MSRIPLKKVLTVFVSLFILLGVLGPWLWRGFDSYQEYDPNTGESILKYRIITKISPLYFSINTEEGDNEINWFYSGGTTLSAIMLFSSVLSNLFLNSKLSWSKGFSFFIAILGVFIFFLSLGGGLWLGVITRFAWGFNSTILGMAVIFLQIMFELFS